VEPIRAIRVVEADELMKQSKSLEKPVSQSRQDGLKMALTKFGLLRGEVMDAVRLESYSRALAEEFKTDVDLLLVLDRLVKARRGEYESKIPEMGDLLEMVRERRSERIREAQQQRERAEWEAYMRDVKEHPDKYFTMQELHAELAGKKAI